MSGKLRKALPIAIACGILAAQAHAANVSEAIHNINRTGAQFALQSAMRIATQIGAPCAVAIVDHEGNLMAFDRFDGVRPGSPDLALGKARTSALLERPSEETENNVNNGRIAFVTSGFVALRGGMPLKVGSEVVGAIGVAGIKKENDARVATEVASAFASEATATH